MKKTVLAIMVTSALAMTGCATIIKGSTQTISFKTTPENSNIQIKNRAGNVVLNGQTPATVDLRKGSGYFKPESYQITFSKAGYQPRTVEVKGTLSGWYFGNFVFGGPIGLFAVDPVNGAMYKLTPTDTQLVLEQNKIKGKKDAQTLVVVLTETLPSKMISNATRIN
ncbi:hypothetical protein [Acinetobacter sp. HY1485]|uniref:hypothetical protein n=1 Tax=Acinetobacter sp. HY1485 TaxID=2970918 RepID=UPI0022B9540E|nr:hypothetical protein [Acinetobacter sp. HY1485]